MTVLDIILIDDLKEYRCLWLERSFSLDLSIKCYKTCKQLLSDLNSKDFCLPRIFVLNEHSEFENLDLAKILKSKTGYTGPIITSENPFEIAEKYFLPQDEIKEKFFGIPCSQWTQTEVDYLQKKEWITIPEGIKCSIQGWFLDTQINPAYIKVIDLANCCRLLGLEVSKSWDCITPSFASNEKMSINFELGDIESSHIIIRSLREDSKFDEIFAELSYASQLFKFKLLNQS